jgi:hypothetical protein
MVTHLVLFRYRSDLPAGSVEAVFEELLGFRQMIPGLTAFQGGAQTSPEGLAQGFTMPFADEAARDADLPPPCCGGQAPADA